MSNSIGILTFFFLILMELRARVSATRAGTVVVYSCISYLFSIRSITLVCTHVTGHIVCSALKDQAFRYVHDISQAKVGT